MRLLLVEDEAAIACRIRESLEEARYAIDWARGGVEALAFVREREYAAIILDLMLPGVDGWEVCETLRRRRDHGRRGFEARPAHRPRGTARRRPRRRVRA